MSSSGILHRPMHWADARDAIERARSEVASLVGAFADEIVFTSGELKQATLQFVATSRWSPRVARW